MMKATKIKSFSIEKGYTVALVNNNGKTKLAVGTEGEGAEYLLSIPEFQPEILCCGPGGTMSILNVPGRDNDLVSIMGLFPPFIGFNAGVYYHLWSENGWSEHKIIDLPFSHRMEWMNADGVATLFVACVSKHKENPADWSQPGVLYAATINSYDQKWTMTHILEGLTRHHGMHKFSQNGVESLLVTAKEGVFNVFWDTIKKQWQTERWLDCEVSEIAMIDLDGDNIDELITIEPFHGTKLVIYKMINNKWERRFETDLIFGHGLCAGLIHGEPTVIVGNRAEGKELLAFKTIDLAVGQMERIVIETDAGPTQTIITKIDNQQYIISSNQNKSEIVLYQVNI
jgi:hypothetical protein